MTEKEFKEIMEIFAHHTVNRMLQTYLLERDGSAIWLAFLECRKLGITIPESIMLKIEEYAKVILSSKNSHDLADKLELNKKGRSGTRESRIKEAAINTDALQLISRLRKSTNLSPSSIDKKISEQFSFSTKHARDLRRSIEDSPSKRGRPAKTKSSAINKRPSPPKFASLSDWTPSPKTKK
nr:hypothetical protein [Burkholderia gladioli]